MTRYGSDPTSFCCLPFAKWRARNAEIHRQRREEFHAARLRQPVKEPQPLNQRRRSLTFHISPESQPRSRLTNLPRELRNQIWKEVLGRMTFLLYLDAQGRYSQIEYLHTKNNITKRGLLGMALSCRQLYSETIHMLYEHNTFCLRSPDAVLHFRAALLPKRFISIRNLWVIWECRGLALANRQMWTSLWEALASFTQLEKLRVEIRTPLNQYDPSWSIQEMELLEAVKAVISPSVFELYLGWNSVIPMELEDLPCEIERPTGKPFKEPSWAGTG